MKKIIILLFMISSSYVAKSQESGYTFYNDITSQWEFVYCNFKNAGVPNAVQSAGPQYLNTQVTEREAGFFSEKGDKVTIGNKNKLTIEVASSYGGKVGSEVNIPIIKDVAKFYSGSSYEVTRKDASNIEVEASGPGREYVSLGQEFEGRGFQFYATLVGRRVGTYCMELKWQKATDSERWEWLSKEVGPPGPNIDGYIYDDRENGKLKYQWFWANWKFVPNSVSNIPSNVAIQAYPILQWGKNFYQETQGFFGDLDKLITLDPYGTSIGGFADLNIRNFNLKDESDPNNKMVLVSSNYTSDLKFKKLGITTITFIKPTSPLNLEAAYYQIPGKGRICHITGGTVKFQCFPTVKILGAENIEYTIDGKTTIKYDPKGTEFNCITPLPKVFPRYPKVIETELPEGPPPGLGFNPWAKR